MGQRLRTVLPCDILYIRLTPPELPYRVRKADLCSIFGTQSVLSRTKPGHCRTSNCIADDAQSAFMQRIFLNVGYELSEKQLRSHFSTFGVLSDLYLPKHTNGRNKGYGFATFASEKSLSLALQQSKHMITGIHVQVRCTAGLVQQETT